MKRFSNWDTALQAAGFDPEIYAPRKKWSKERVIRVIHDRASNGSPLNSAYVAHHASDLCNAAMQRFGSWENALCEAGIDPTRVRKKRKWTGGLLLDRIRSDVKNGLPVNAAQMESRDPGLFTAAIDRFGSWDNTLRTAGFNPEEHRLRHKARIQEDIIAFIHDAYLQGRPLNFHAIQPRSILPAAKQLFGSWDNALRNAGLDPQIIRKRHPISKNEIIAQIQARATRGEALHHSAVVKTDYALARRGQELFGGWTEALNAAGFDGNRFHKNSVKWTRLRIVETLLWRKATGLSLASGVIYRIIPHYAMLREFGGRAGAYEAAGITG